MTYEDVIAWVSSHYGPEDFGLSEDDLKEKLIEDGNYDLGGEVGEVLNKLVKKNPNFSNGVLEEAYSRQEIIENFVTSDFERLKQEAKMERQIRQQSESRRRKEELREQGIEPDF